MAVNSHEEAVALGQGRVIFEGTYQFHTPNSINAPHGTFTLTITEVEELKASGTINIITLWGIPTHTTLTYTNAEAQFNGSTGYTTVNGIAHGTMIYDYNKKKAITANINMSLIPGMRSGELTVEEFGEDMPCQATQIRINELPG